VTARQFALTFIALVLLLGAVAAIAPEPWFVTDVDVYEATAQRYVVADCSDLQCFRLLGSWIVGRLPGPTVVRWKAYAVVSIAGAAVALGRLCIVMGLTPRAAQHAMWLMAFGFGPALTLYNPYSADPLMYLAGPLLMGELLRGRRARATVLAVVGVFAKEVAAAPLWIYWLWAVLRRQWNVAARAFAMACGATLVWVWLQLVLMIFFNYSYAGSKSTDLLHGGDLAVWLGTMGLRGGLQAVVGSFGAMYLLVPVGFTRAGRDLRLLAIAALPAAAALSYVQQPDRALWNFHYVIIPLAVLVLQPLSVLWSWLFVACCALAGLRIGAQLLFIPDARYLMALSLPIAVAAIVATLRQPRAPQLSLAAREAGA
jgi:hypothetical protein